MTLQNFADIDRERCHYERVFERLNPVARKGTSDGLWIFRLLISPVLILAFAISPRFALAQYPAHPDTSTAICATDLSARDKAIADDSFQGRGPGTVAGEAAADWIADEMKRVGLRPGNHGSYFQPVPAVTITLDAAKSVFAFNTPDGA